MKQRTGLGKQVSSIFNGVAVPTSARSGIDRGTTSANASPISPAPQLVREDRVNVAFQDRSRQAVSYDPPVNQRRQNIAKIAVVVLSVLFVAAIYHALNPSTPGRTVSATPAVTVTQHEPAAPPKPIAIEWQIPDSLPATIRDPMGFPTAGSIHLSDAAATQTDVSQEFIKVSGIVFSEDNPSAIINGQVVYRGQKIGNITVTNITKTEIQFKSADRTWSQKVEL